MKKIGDSVVGGGPRPRPPRPTLSKATGPTPRRPRPTLSTLTRSTPRPPRPTLSTPPGPSKPLRNRTEEPETSPNQGRRMVSQPGIEFSEEFCVLQGIYGVECVQIAQPSPNQRWKEVTLIGGKAHGITSGAEFTLYESSRALWEGSGKPLGVMIARQENISIFSTILEPAGEDFHFKSPEAIAIQTKVGDLSDLRVHIPANDLHFALRREVSALSDAEPPDQCTIELVDKDEAQLEIIASSEGSQLTLNVLDVFAAGYGLNHLPHIIDSSCAQLGRILNSITQYHQQLNLVRPNPMILNGIDVEFFPLTEDYDEDGEVCLSRDHGGEDMCQNGMIEVQGDEGAYNFARKRRKKKRYGMRVTNRTPWDLHFACFYFDHVNFSITPFTDVPEHYQTPRPLRRKSCLEIGYGDSDIPPLVFNDVPQGLNIALGFLKFHFFYFPEARHALSATPFSGTLKIPVVQRRSSLNPCRSPCLPSNVTTSLTQP